MIPVALIVGASLIVGMTLVARFWRSIQSYLIKAIQKVSEAIHRAVLGVRIFLKKAGDKVIQITKNYSQDKETRKWHETIVKRELKENEVPKDKRERLMMEDEFDISDELENQLRSA